MDSFLEGFKAMTAELGAHRDVVLTHVHIRPPAHNLWLRKAGSLMNGNLPESLLQFYKSCNGLQLRWMHRRAEAYDPGYDYRLTKGQEFDLEMPPEDGGQATGCINILPMEWVFGGRSWEGMIWRHTTSNLEEVEFAGRKYPRLDFLQSVQPFDQFDTDYNVAMIYLAQDGQGMPMVMGSGHHSDYMGTARLEPGAYFEFLLRTKGLVAARPRHLCSASGALKHFTLADALSVPVLDLDHSNMDF